MFPRSTLASVPVRVLVVDDDAAARRALREALSRAPGVDVVGDIGSGGAAISAIDASPPDVVVIDADMPEVDGITATRRIIGRHPELPVLVLSSADDEELAVLALRAGASGFLSKEVPVDAIIRAACAAARGDAAISRRLTRRVIDEMRRASAGLGPKSAALNGSDWEIVDLLGAGASTDELAGALGVSSATARARVKQLLRKLGAHSRAEAVEAAERLSGTASTPTHAAAEKAQALRRLQVLRSAREPEQHW